MLTFQVRRPKKHASPRCECVAKQLRKIKKLRSREAQITDDDFTLINNQVHLSRTKTYAGYLR